MTGIIILNFNNSSQTLKCLNSLYTYCIGRNYRVCVVDNASEEKQLNLLVEGLKAYKGRGSEPHLVIAEHNGGYARGNNLGCHFFEGESDVDNILILNDDTLFTMDIITPMEEYLIAHPKCGVVFPLVISKDGCIDIACVRRQKSSLDLILQATSLGKLGVKRK